MDIIWNIIYTFFLIFLFTSFKKNLAVSKNDNLS